MEWHLPLYLLSFVLLQKQKPQHKIQSPSFPPCFTPCALKSTTSSGIWWGRPPNIWAFLIHFSLGRYREGGKSGLPTTVPRAHRQLLKHQSLSAGLGGTEWRVGILAGGWWLSHFCSWASVNLLSNRVGSGKEVSAPRGARRTRETGCVKGREPWAELRDAHDEQLYSHSLTLLSPFPSSYVSLL